VSSQFREAISRNAADATLGHPTKSFSSVHEEGLKRSGGLMGVTTGACNATATGFLMREDFASSSFLVLIVISLTVVCAGLVALGL
jgi:hypothetical protein